MRRCTTSTTASTPLEDGTSLDDEVIFQQVGSLLANIALNRCHERFDLTIVLEDVDHVLLGELCHVHYVDRWRWLERSSTQLGLGLLAVQDLARDHLDLSAQTWCTGLAVLLNLSA